jgi:hypothetical protein
MNMKIMLACLAAFLMGSAAAVAHPFETQAQIEARVGPRFCNGAETSDYKIFGYALGNLNVWVMYIEGFSGGELYYRDGQITEMEAATFLEANKGQSVWQAEKVQGTKPGQVLKVWNRKDGKLHAMLEATAKASYFMIGTKKAERLMISLTNPDKLLERVLPRDRMQ